MDYNWIPVVEKRSPLFSSVGRRRPVELGRCYGEGMSSSVTHSQDQRAVKYGS